MSRTAESALAIVVAIVLLAGVQVLWPSAKDPLPAVSATSQSVDSGKPEVSDRSVSLTAPLTHYDPFDHTGPALVIPTAIETLLNNGAWREARAELMALAEKAVNDGDKHALARSLTLLGMAALAEPDLDAAELFFVEALDIHKSQGDSAGAARVYMQIGHLHVIARERARRAASAYDTLLVARWKISHKQFYEAQSELQQVIDSNIALQRFGAAASASESMIRAWHGIGDNWQAQQAAMQAVRLHAASGQRFKAEHLIDELRVNHAGGESIDIQAMQLDVEHLLAEFDSSVQQIERARDYRRLYNHYRAKGDEHRAWKFRLLASQSLAGVSKRAMYHRQPDVLVALYGSNRSMELADKSLREAQSYFNATGSANGVRAVRELQAQIY